MTASSNARSNAWLTTRRARLLVTVKRPASTAPTLDSIFGCYLHRMMSKVANLWPYAALAVVTADEDMAVKTVATIA